jgi:hypothetical protein
MWEENKGGGSKYMTGRRESFDGRDYTQSRKTKESKGNKITT